MKLDRNFSETVTAGTRTLGRITTPLSTCFAVEHEIVGHLPMTATLAEARRLLHDIDQALLQQTEMQLLYIALAERNQEAMSGHGRAVDPKLMADALAAFEAAEARVAELAGVVR